MIVHRWSRFDSSGPPLLRAQGCVSWELVHDRRTLLALGMHVSLGRRGPRDPRDAERCGRLTDDGIFEAFVEGFLFRKIVLDGLFDDGRAVDPDILGEFVDGARRSESSLIKF